MQKEEIENIPKEDVQLLLQDLSERLCYNQKVAVYMYVGNKWFESTLKSVNPSEEKIKIGTVEYDVRRCRPYLRPMSSMTHEEREEWHDEVNTPMLDLEQLDYDSGEMAYKMAPKFFAKAQKNGLVWLRKKHFDYNNLIGLGLAFPDKEYAHELKTKKQTI